MNNAYPELPALDYVETSVAMPDVTAYLASLPIATEVKRAAYIMFRIESGNGARGINNNYCGFQADGSRWDARFDPLFAGTVTMPENQTGVVRVFLAFHDWRGCIDMLCDRVESRGLYIGGKTHLVAQMAIATEVDLATAYLREWVKGAAAYRPTQAELAGFESMYGQAAALFRGAVRTPAPAPAPIFHDAPEAVAEASVSTNDDAAVIAKSADLGHDNASDDDAETRALNDAELQKITGDIK